MINNEHEIQQHIQIQAMNYNCHLMRNNSGAFLDENNRLVRFGLDNTSKARNDKIKSSDLIGFTKIVITPEMVGQTVAVFTAIEVKKPDWNPAKVYDNREKAQSNFISWIRNNGGLAGFANAVDNLKFILRK